MTEIIESCYGKAVDVLKACSTPYGLFASAGKDGYDAIWARDSMISLLGGSLVKDNFFKNLFKKNLMLLAENQSRKGQIPNAVDKFSKRKPHVDYQSIDSTLWYIIGYYIYKKRYSDNAFFRKNKSSIKKALLWLDYQDTGEKSMLTQQPTSDWQDAFPHKYGYTINTQALYYKVLTLAGNSLKAERLKFMANENKDTKLWNGRFYCPYRWKNHNKYQEIGNWFDSLGNLLTVVFNLADKAKSKKILSYIEKNKINRPYPVRAIHPAIKKGSRYWKDYFEDSDARLPNHYLNGGIWTYIGGVYILSLIKLRKFKEAEIEMKKLAEANLRGNFPEWISPVTKKAYGRLQAWDAGMYILAYHSIKKKKVLI